jgi:hypothetical protein
MNKKQKIVLMIGIIVFLLIGIFPPWVLISSPENSARLEGAIGYSFIIFSPNHGWCRIDISRLMVEWITMVVVMGGLILLFNDKLKE